MRSHNWLVVVAACVCSWLTWPASPAFAQAGAGQAKKPPADQRDDADKLAELTTSLQAVYQTTPTAAQQKAVQKSLSALFPKRNRPVDLLSTLGGHLTTAAATGRMTPEVAAKLSQDVAAVYRSAKNPQAAIATVQADLQGLRTTTRLRPIDIRVLANDVDALVRPILQAAQGQ